MRNEVEKGRPDSTLSLRLCTPITKPQQNHCFSPILCLPVRISEQAQCTLRSARSGFLWASRVPSPLPSRQGGRVETCLVAGLQQCSCALVPTGWRESLRTMQTWGPLAVERPAPSQHARRLKGSRLRLHRRQEVACKGAGFQHRAEGIKPTLTITLGCGVEKLGRGWRSPGNSLKMFTP